MSPRFTQQLTEGIADLFVQQRWIPALIVIVCTAIAALGLSGKTFEDRLGESDTAMPLDENRALLTEVQDQFGLEQLECFVVFDGKSVFTKSNIQAMLAAKEALAQLPQVDSVVWLDDLPTLNLFGLTEPLLPETNASEEEYAASRERVLENPLVMGQLISEDGTTALMPLRYNWLRYKNADDITTDVVATVKEVLSAYPNCDLRVRLTGNAPLFQAIERAFSANRLRFQIIGYVLVFILSVILFRGWRAVLIVGAAPMLGIFWSTGILDFFQFQRNGLTSVVMPVLVTMVGMTDAIHVMLHIRRRGAEGMEPIEACRDAIVRVGPACALTSLTTAIGFLSLLLARTAFIQNFGHGCTWAVCICFVAVMTVIPLLSSTWLGRDLHRGYEKDLVGRGLNRFGGVMHWIVTHARLVSWGGILLTVALSGVALTLRPDAKTTENLPDHSEAAQTLAHCDRTMGGIDFVRVVVNWPAAMAGDDPAIMRAVERVHTILDDEPLLRHPVSIRSIATTLAPDDANIDEQMSLLELIPPPLLELLYNAEARRALVTVRLQDLGIAKYRPVFRHVLDDMKKLEAEFPGFAFDITGEPVVEGRELTQIVYDLAASLGTASVIIFLVMMIAYRSIRIGLISVVPNILPLAVTAASLVFLGKSLTVTSVCAFTVCIGIAVDDTIHFLTRFLHESQDRGETREAIESAFHAVGAAMVTTTLVLVTGFGAVLFSELPTHRTFATMAVCTIVAALVADLVLLPAILAYFYPPRQEKLVGENRPS